MLKISVTFHEEGTPIATVTFKWSGRKLKRMRIKYNRARRAGWGLKHWDEQRLVSEKMGMWREHHNKGDTLA
jgi:hypothetical protein